MDSFLEIKRRENRIKYSHLIGFNPSKTPLGGNMAVTPVDKSKSKKKAFAKYRRKVKDITNQVDKQMVHGYNPSTVFVFKIHGCLTKNHDKLVIDHKIPIIYGFKNGIPPESIGHVSNLQYISVRDNLLKGVVPSIDSYNKWITE